VSLLAPLLVRKCYSSIHCIFIPASTAWCPKIDDKEIAPVNRADKRMKSFFITQSLLFHGL
jgi:hypothetical protein